MAPTLPIELISRVIILLFEGQKRSLKVLLPLLQVSPTFRLETERILYTNITLISIPQTIRCFTTINNRPNLSKTVRSLCVRLNLNSDAPTATFFNFDFLLNNPTAQQERRDRENKNLGRVLRGFTLLVTRTIPKLTQLQDYTLSFGNRQGRDETPFARAWLPPRAVFRLRRFIIDLNLSNLVAAFICGQPHITDLLAPFFKPERMSFLPPTALPKLKGVVCSSPVAQHLVPRRPLRRVCLKDAPGLDMSVEPILTVLPALAQSTMPVKHFEVLVPDVGPSPDELLDALSTHLQNLESITLRRVFTIDENPYTVYASDRFCAALTKFPKLKHLLLPAPTTSWHLHEAGYMGNTLAGGPFVMQANINAQIFQGNVPPPPAFDGAGVPPPPPPPAAGGLQGNANTPPQGQAPPNGGPIAGGWFTLPLGTFGQLGNDPPPAQGPAAPPPPAHINLQMLQQFNTAMNAALGPPTPVGPTPGPIAAPAPAPPAAGHGLPPGVVTHHFIIQGNATFPLPGAPGAAAHQGPPPPFIFGPPPPVVFGPPPPPGPPVFGPTPPPPAQPAFPIGNPLQTLQELQANVNAAHQEGNTLNAQINQATNAVFNLITQMAGAVPGLAGPAPLHAEGEPADEDMNDLPPLMPIPPGPAGPDAGAPPAPENANLDGGVPPPPLGFNTTFVGLIDPTTGAPIDENAPRRSVPPDPKREEILENAKRELKDKELALLEKWKMGGYAPNLKSTAFDMDTKRRTQWIWKKSEASSDVPATVVAESEDEVDGTPDVPTIDGRWEVEYIQKG